MEQFSIIADSNGLKLEILEVWDFPGRTAYPGGYSTKSKLDIWSGGFRATGMIYITTGEIFKFYDQLEKAYRSLSGNAQLSCFDGDFQFTLSFKDRGRFEIIGVFGDMAEHSNRLHFTMEADQSFIGQSLEELVAIVAKYGDLKGKRHS